MRLYLPLEMNGLLDGEERNSVLLDEHNFDFDVPVEVKAAGHGFSFWDGDLSRHHVSVGDQGQRASGWDETPLFGQRLQKKLKLGRASAIEQVLIDKRKSIVQWAWQICEMICT